MVHTNLTLEDHQHIHSFCRELFACGGVDELRQESLVFFEKNLGAEKSNFFMAEAPDKPVSFMRIVNRGIEETALLHYRRYYWQIDPFYRKFAEQKPGEISDVLTTEDIVSYRNFTRTEYYNDFLKPQSIHHQMTLHLRSGMQMLGVVALFKSRRAGGFSARDKSKALTTVPYLSGALKTALASEKRNALESTLSALMPELSYKGVVILDRFLDPVFMDERAASLLSCMRDAERACGSGFGALWKEISGHCKKLLAERRKKEDSGASELLFELLSGGAGQKVSVRVRLVYDRRSGPLFLLLLNPEDQVLGMTRFLRSAGLTRREVEVVSLLARGSRNADIAKKLYISEYTVENHLKSIYRKMGVPNRTAVVHRLLQVQGDLS